MKNIYDFCHEIPRDWTPIVRTALKSECDGIFFPEGEYHFYPDEAEIRYLFISNNDEGLKKVIFFIEGKKPFSIIGDFAEFIFHDRVVPFYFSECAAVCLQGFNIDFAIPQVIEAEVIDVDDDYTTLLLPDDRPYHIIDGKICFLNDEYKFMQPKMTWFVFDEKKREIKEGRAPGNFSLKAKEIKPHVVKVANNYHYPEQGDQIVIKAEPRLNPGIVFSSCRDVHISQINLFSSGGMGIIAQNSFDFSLGNVNIQVRDKGKRRISVSDDAVHFSNCGGKILIQDCIFENQLDDAVNIHGIYRKYLYFGESLLATGHYQQMGIPFALPGERILIGDKCFEIKTIYHEQKQYEAFETNETLPSDLEVNTPVMNLDRQPDVEIMNCRIRGNRPRGILCSSGGKVCIENNRIHTPGAGIFIAGDSRFWYEAGPVTDVLIQNNTFDNCFYQKYCTSTRAVIDIHPTAEKMIQTYFHHNIRVMHNHFLDNHNLMLCADNVDGLIFANNTWEYDKTYSAQPSGISVRTDHCVNVQISK